MGEKLGGAAVGIGAEAESRRRKNNVNKSIS